MDLNFYIGEYKNFKEEYKKEIVQMHCKNEQGLLYNSYQLFYQYLQMYYHKPPKEVIEYFELKCIETIIL